MCRCFLFFNDRAPTEFYPLSLHDALPIFAVRVVELADEEQVEDRVFFPPLRGARRVFTFDDVALANVDDRLRGVTGVRAARSEERRVGKECRSRWSAYH